MPAKMAFYWQQTRPNSSFSHKILQVQQVSHDGLIERAAAQPLFKLAIRPGEAVMLAKVFCPRVYDKCFEISVWVLEVSTNSPSRRAIAASDASVLVHGLDK